MSKSTKPAKKRRVPVDGTAVNEGWTLANMRYNRKYYRDRIAREQEVKTNGRIVQEIKEGERETVHVPASF